jgi:predicted dehydrogenase
MAREGALALGIVGCGAVAQRVYAVTLPRVPAVRTAFVCDLDRQAARALARRLDARVASFEEICARADAVIIATPPSSHLALVGQSLERRRIVVCEKPFAGRAADAAALVERAQRSGSRLHVAHFRRLFPAAGLARRLIAGGALGGLRRIDVAEGSRFDWGPRSDYPSRDPLGGVLFDTGSHALDMALYAAGLDERPLAVRVRAVRRDRPEPAHELDAEFDLEGDFPAVAARLRLSRYRALANRIRFELEGGTLDLSTRLRETARLGGPRGSAVRAAPPGAATVFDCFVAQWNAVFSPGDELLAARRFIGLTAVLEALAA